MLSGELELECSLVAKFPRRLTFAHCMYELICKVDFGITSRRPAPGCSLLAYAQSAKIFQNGKIIRKVGYGYVILRMIVNGM